MTRMTARRTDGLSNPLARRRFNLDLEVDGTIAAAPAFFSLVIRPVRDAGGEVHVVRWRVEREDEQHELSANTGNAFRQQLPERSIAELAGQESPLTCRRRRGDDSYTIQGTQRRDGRNA